jgi:ribosome-associated translation inhibitor RaiA
VSDNYEYWKSAIAGRPIAINAEEPQAGYYWMRRAKDGPRVPVFIKTVDGEMMARVGAQSDLVEAKDIWTYCASNAVGSYQAKHAFQHGKWPGDIDSPAMGHNSGNAPIAEQIEILKGDARDWMTGRTLASQDDADMAANFATALSKLAKQADTERLEAVRPHLEEQRRINAEYQPIIEDAKQAAKVLDDAARKWVDAENARRRKEAEEAARAEAERIRKEAEDAGDWLTATAPEPVMAPEVAPIKVGGQFGNRTGGSRKKTEYVVTDYAAFLAANVDHPDIQAAADKLAAKIGKAGVKCNGMEKRVSGVKVAA